ncbi:MAG: hypothetical protein FJY77_01540 [Candidatus Altiarchaeales archaeon]|nr:hypothetical protein [Candidatus Altiarchaeales archaeon]
MKFIGGSKIRLDRVLSELDKRVLSFTRILERHVEYVIVSGYVSILFGRARATEDVDIFVKRLSEKKFAMLYENLLDKGYWCLNAEDFGEVYSYLRDGLAVRFALKGEVIPNFEVKFAGKRSAKEAIENPLSVVLRKGVLKISPLEQQMAFKRYFLKSQKDLEDAKHIEGVFREHLDEKKIKRYRKLIEDEKT